MHDLNQHTPVTMVAGRRAEAALAEIWNDLDQATIDHLLTRGKQMMFDECAAFLKDFPNAWEDSEEWVRRMWAAEAAQEQGLIAAQE